MLEIPLQVLCVHCKEKTLHYLCKSIKATSRTVNNKDVPIPEFLNLDSYFDSEIKYSFLNSGVNSKNQNKNYFDNLLKQGPW